MPEVGPLRDLESWFRGERDDLIASGYAISMHRGSGLADKRSAWVEIESPRAAGQIIVWDSGEVDIEAVAKRDGATLLAETRTVETRAELEDAARTLVAALRSP
jgi:hypothetical protein